MALEDHTLIVIGMLILGIVLFSLALIYFFNIPFVFTLIVITGFCAIVPGLLRAIRKIDDSFVPKNARK